MRRREPAAEGPPRHRQSPHLFTRIDYSLKPEGLLEEEYTSDVLTHSKVLPYEDVWEGYFDRRIPWRWWVPPALLGAAAAAFGLFGYPLAAAALAPGALVVLALALTFGWRALFTAFDYEGHWVVTFEGPAGREFGLFLEAYQERIQARRYPLQKHLEGLPLGEVSVSGPLVRWSCSFRYDRIVVERRGRWKWLHRRYHSLSVLHAPVRLVWKPSWPALGLLASAAGAFALSAVRGWSFAGGTWLWPALGLAAGFVLPLAAGRVAVSAPAGEGSVESPAFPIWRLRELRKILLWFSRLANLADRLEELRSDDYWEYHREKVNILQQQGFLEDWPYRSTLGRINSNEREEMGE